MHVLIIPSWYPQFAGDPGGSFFREQAIALSQRLDKVGVIFPNQRSLRELWNQNSSAPGVLCVNDAGTQLVQRNGFNWTPRWGRGVAMQFLHHGIRLYATYVERHGTPDIIHAHSAFYGGRLAQEIARTTGVSYIVTEHSSGYFKNSIQPWQLVLARDVFEHSAANIAVSQSLGALLMGRYSFGKSWKVVPNIVSDAFFSQPIKLVDRGKFINVALLDPIKRQDILVDAISICRDLGRFDLTLTIAGDGQERDRLHRRIRDLGLCEQIRMTGLVSRAEVPALMAAHDAFVLSSDYETFGVVVAEALAIGLPCVATDCGGPADILKADDGLVVDRGDARAIANAMIRIADRPYNSRERQERRERCADRFSEDAVCRALNTIYSAAISR